MDLVRKLLMSPMSRKKNANNSNKRLSMPVCSQTANIPLKSRNKETSHNQSSVSISLHQSSTSLLSNTGSTRELKYFGESLQDILNREQGKVPRLVVVASQFICDRGLQQEGLFRVSGNARAIENLKVAIGRSGEVTIGDDAEVGTVASLLKMFFRHLPDSLIPQEVTEPFLRLMSNNSHAEDRVFKELRQLCQNLPASNYNTLKYLIQLLVLVARHENYNKMSPQALGIVFGPNIFRTNMKNQGLTNYIVKCFISGYDKIFRTSEEVLSLGAGEISNPIILRPAPSRPRRHSDVKDFPPAKLKLKREPDWREDESKIVGGDDNDGTGGEVDQSPINQSLPSSTPWSLGVDNERDTPSQRDNTDEPSPFDDAIPNDESLHSLKCLEEEISMIISNNLFPMNTVQGDNDEETSRSDMMSSDSINMIPKHNPLMNYHRVHGPKNRKLPSIISQKNFNGNIAQLTARKCFTKREVIDAKPISRHSAHQQIIPSNNVTRVSNWRANDKTIRSHEPEIKKVVRRGSFRQANHAEDSRRIVKSGKEEDGTKDAEQAGDDDNDPLKGLLICIDKIEHYPPEKVTRRKVMPGQSKRARVPRTNNSNMESSDVTMATNNSCICKDDDDDEEDDEIKNNNGEAKDGEDSEKMKCEKEESMDQEENEISGSIVSVKSETSHELPPTLPPKTTSNSSESKTSRPPLEDISNDFPSPDNISNDSAAEGVSLLMNLSRSSLQEEMKDELNGGGGGERRGSVHFHQRADADESGASNCSNLSVSMTKFQEASARNHFISDFNNFFNPESHASIEEQIQECLSDLQRFRDNMRILEEKYISRFNQKPSKIARMIDKDMNYYETQIKKCHFMLRKLRSLKQRLPPSSSSDDGRNEKEGVENSPGRHNDRGGDQRRLRLIDKCDVFCCNLAKKKEDIEQLRSRLFEQQEVSLVESPRVHRARKMSSSSSGVGGEVVRAGHQMRREGAKSLSPFRHLPLEPVSSRKEELGWPSQALVDKTLSLIPSEPFASHEQDHHHNQQHHHHHHQQQQSINKSPRGRQIVLEPISREVDEGMKELKHSMECMEQELEGLRIKDNRNFSINLMTREELKREKNDMQRALLKFESTFGRPTTKPAKSLVKSIYARYSDVKKELRRFDESSRVSPVQMKIEFSDKSLLMSTKISSFLESREGQDKGHAAADDDDDDDHDGNNDDDDDDDLNNDDNDIGDDRAKKVKVEKKDENKTDPREGESGDGRPGLVSARNSMAGLEMLLNKFALTQLVDERSRLLMLKAGMITDLKTFDKNFKKINGRDIQKTDKLLKQDSYFQLKELKAQLQLIESLIDKKYKEEENKNQ